MRHGFSMRKNVPNQLKERLSAKLAEKAMSAREVSIAALGKPDAIRAILAGHMPGLDRLEAIAAVLNTTADWLLGRENAVEHVANSESDTDRAMNDRERKVLAAIRQAGDEEAEAALSMLQPADDPHPNAGRIVELLVERASPKQMQSVVRILSGKSNEIDVQIAAEQLDLVPVASIDASYGMGATFLEDDIAVDTRWFPRAWLESVTNTAPSNLTWARGRGNSMSPTIEDQDLLLIDRSDLVVRDQDAIWALTIGEIGMLKRLRIRGEKVTILSDNDRVPDDHAHIGEINIVGRVSHIVRRL